MFDAQPSDIAPGALQQHGHFASAWRACGPGPLILAGADPVLVLRRRLRGLPVAMLARAQLYEPGGLARRLREAGLHQKCRNRLRHAKQQGLRLTRQNMPLDPGHWLMRAEAAQRRTRTNPGRHLGLGGRRWAKACGHWRHWTGWGAVDNWTG